MSQPYQIRVTNRFERDFRKLPPQTQERVRAALEILGNNPYAFEVLSGEYRGLRRLRVGDYRIIHRIEEPERRKIVWLLFIAHRRRAYK